MTIASTDAPKGAVEKKKPYKKPPISTLGDYFRNTPGFDTFKSKLEKPKRRPKPDRFKSSDRKTRETMNRGQKQ